MKGPFQFVGFTGIGVQCYCFLCHNCISPLFLSTAGKTTWEVEQQQLAKVRSLADKRWKVSHRIDLWVGIQVSFSTCHLISVLYLLNYYLTGTKCFWGICSRWGDPPRLHGRWYFSTPPRAAACIPVRPVCDSGTLVCETVTCVEIGSVSVRSKLQKQLDTRKKICCCCVTSGVAHRRPRPAIAANTKVGQERKWCPTRTKFSEPVG